jgi:hypothetical protein
VETEPEAIGRPMAAWQAYEAAREAAVLIACDGLEPAHTATTIRVADGRRHVTNGPVIETKEQLGGHVLLEVRNLDEAMEWAERLLWSNAREGEGCCVASPLDGAGFAAEPCDGACCSPGAGS